VIPMRGQAENHHLCESEPTGPAGVQS